MFRRNNEAIGFLYKLIEDMKDLELILILNLTSNNVKTYLIVLVKLCYTLVLCIPILYTKIQELHAFA